MEKDRPTDIYQDVKFIVDILDRLETGKLRVPNFQRPFVWKPEGMIDLFDSINEGYPIGSLLFWEAKEKFNTLFKIGPHKIPLDSTLPINYILDGHQRLSTLFGVLVNLNTEKDEDWRFIIYYDLKEKVFLHEKNVEEIRPWYFPMRHLLRTTDFLKETRKIINNNGNQGEDLVIEAEKLLKRIRGYKIAFTQINGGGLESAVHIFSRLNTKGVHMAIDRMYSALTYKEGDDAFNLATRIDEIKTKLSKYHFDKTDRMSIFRAILAAAGKNLYSKGKLDLFEKDQDRLPGIVNECEKSILKTAKFLHNDLGVPSSSFLPHSLQFVILSEFFRLAVNPSELKLKMIKKWFWVTSFVGMNIVNSSKKRQTLKEVKDFAEISEEEAKTFRFSIVNFSQGAKPFPDRFDLNSARVKAFCIFLGSLKPRNLITGKLLNYKEILASHGYNALGYITNQGKSLQSSPANRIIIDPTEDLNPKKILLSGHNLNLFENDPSVNNSLKLESLDSHGITDKALSKLINGQDDSFLKEREIRLIELEDRFLEKRGITPGDSSSRSQSIPDAD